MNGVLFRCPLCRNGVPVAPVSKGRPLVMSELTTCSNSACAYLGALRAFVVVGTERPHLDTEDAACGR